MAFNQTQSLTTPLPPAALAEAQRQFEAFLRCKGLKQTRQRQQILETFLGTDDHLTAEELYQLVQKRESGIGFATVYRTLHLIVESGIARQREFSAGRKYYEHVFGEQHHHHHLICTTCGKIVEFICPEVVERAQEETARLYGFVLQGHVHELFGICGDCQKARAPAIAGVDVTQVS